MTLSVNLGTSKQEIERWLQMDQAEYEEYPLGPIPVAARSKMWTCGHLPAGIVDSNIARSMGIYLLQILCFLLAEATVTGRSLVQGRPSQCLCVTQRDQVQE